MLNLAITDGSGIPEPADDWVIFNSSSVYIQMVTDDSLILNSSSVYIHPDDD